MPVAPIPDARPPALTAPAPIVVTGRALPDPASDKAFSVTLIDRRALVDNPSGRLDAVLRQVGGFQLFRRSNSVSAHPTSQGATLRGLGGNASSRVAVTLDGVPQADPFGGWIDWPAYDPSSLVSVRVLRGGGSVAQGPGALAGAIELTSLADRGLQTSLEAGSRASLAASAFAGEPLGPGLLTVSAHASRGDGFTPLTLGTRGPVDRPAAYAEGGARLRWIAPVGNHLELQLAGLAFLDRRERGLPLTGNRTRGGDGSLRLVGSGRWPWSATTYAQVRNFRSSFASANAGRTSAERVSLQDSVPGSAVGGALEVRPPLGSEIELRIGADGKVAWGRSNELYGYAQGLPTRRRVAGGLSETVGAFADGSWSSGPVTLSGGVRLDRWRIADGKLVERQLATGIVTRDQHDPPRRGWRPTARAGAVIGLGKGFSVRSAAYLGWRLPTLNELFRPFRAGRDATAANPLLKPERLRGMEAGADWRRGGLSVSLSAFANRLQDAIASVTLGHGPGQFPGVGFVAGDYRQRLNVAAVRVRGIELSTSARSGPWSLRADASFVDARLDAGGVARPLDGLRPAQTPATSLAVTAGWSSARREASLVVTRSGAQYDDDLNQRRLPAATMVGAFAAIPLAARWQLFGRAENLFDAHVVASRGDDQTVERASPRSVWIGIRFDATPAKE